MTEIKGLLSKIGLSSNQSEVFLAIYQYGPKPASTIAKIVGGERTNIYKLIQKLVSQGLVAESTQNNIKQFYIPNRNVIGQRITQQKEQIEKQEQLVPLIENELQKFDQQRASPIPKMRFFEGKEGMDSLFEDMRNLIESKGYLMIKCIASNTLESQSNSVKQLGNYADNFLSKIKENKIHIDSYIGDGILTLEQISKTGETDILPGLPAGNDAVNVFIAGETIYLIIFKNVPFGLKIQSESFANMMHFLLKQI